MKNRSTLAYSLNHKIKAKALIYWLLGWANLMNRILMLGILRVSIPLREVLAFKSQGTVFVASIVRKVLFIVGRIF
jgi:hypothetical protein